MVAGLIRFSFTFIGIVVMALNAYSKNIEIYDKGGKRVNGDTVLVAYQPSSDHGWMELSIYFNLKNNTSKPMSIGVRKREFNIRFDEYHSFCLAGFCYDSSVFISTYEAVLGAGAIDSSFSGHFRFDNLKHPPGVCIVAYTFYDINNPNDSSFVYVNFDTRLSASDIGWNFQTHKRILAYPNPTKNNFYLELEEINPESKFQIFSTNGQEVLCFPLFGLDKYKVIDVSALTPGIYFYRFINSQLFYEAGRIVIAGD